MDTVEIKCLRTLRRKQQKRRWLVEVKVNEQKCWNVHLRDPFTEAEYENIFQWYLSESWLNSPVDVLWTEADEQGREERINRAKQNIMKYREELFRQLKLNEKNRYKTSCLELFICENFDGKNQYASIHSLAWELLEEKRLWKQRPFRISITRITTRSPDEPRGTDRGVFPKFSNSSFRLLLVISRSFKRVNNTFADARADIVQTSLFHILKGLRTYGYGDRFEVELIRPGTFEELECHLEQCHRGKLHFDLVHFDLHGLIKFDPR